MPRKRDGRGRLDEHSARLRGRAFRLIALPPALALVALLGLASEHSVRYASAAPPDPVAAARRAVASTPSGGDLTVIAHQQSGSVDFVHFQRTLNGLPVFGDYVSVTERSDATEPPLVLGNQRTVLVSVDGVSVSADRARGIARRAVGVRKAAGGDGAEPVYFVVGGKAIRSWQVVVPAADPLGDWLVIVSAVDGAVFLQENMMAFDSGSVFATNPVTSSGGSVPPPVDCDSAANAATLAAQQSVVTLLGINTVAQGNALGKLKGQYVDLTAPGIAGTGWKSAGLAQESSHNYIYPCNDDKFEEVMVYYHIDRVQRLIQSLGFPGASGPAIHSNPVGAHAHYDNGCPAFYSPLDLGVHFPDAGSCAGGGVADRGEDSQIIVHEYGHALHDSQAAGTGWIGSEPPGLAEGFGDALAALVFDDPCMFRWTTAVGLPTVPCYRDLRNGFWLDPSNPPSGSYHTIYPDDLAPDPHATGLIWSHTIWRIYQDLLAQGDPNARTKVLTLILRSNFSLNAASTFLDSFLAIRQADIDLYAGTHVGLIMQDFAASGILCGSAHAYTCMTGFHQVLYSTPSSPINNCSAQVFQSDGSDASDVSLGIASPGMAIRGRIDCTTEHMGTLSGRLDPNDPLLLPLGVIATFTTPPLTVSSWGTVSADGTTSSGGWDCVPTSCTGGTFSSARYAAAASALVPRLTGGSVTTSLGDRLTVPAGSLPADTNISIEMSPLSSPPPSGVTRVISRQYRMQPSGTVFSPPASMEFQYTDADVVGGLDPLNLRVMVFDGTAHAWVSLAPSTVNTSAKTITVPISHFSEFAIFDCPTACAPSLSVGGIAEQPEVTSLPSATVSSGRDYTAYILSVVILVAGGSAVAISWRKRRG